MEETILRKAIRSMSGKRWKDPKTVSPGQVFGTLSVLSYISPANNWPYTQSGLSTIKYSKTIVLWWMIQNLHSTLPLNTSKIQVIIFAPRSLHWGRTKSGSHYWKLLKTIPFAKLAFQSYTIQAYLWLCSSFKWLPERKKSRFIHIFIDSSSAKNVVSTKSLSKCSGNKGVPVTSFVHIHEKEPSQSVTTESEQLEFFFQVINCPATKMSCKSETSDKPLESHFVSRS